jgi:hypothetical protein
VLLCCTRICHFKMDLLLITDESARLLPHQITAPWYNRTRASLCACSCTIASVSPPPSTRVSYCFSPGACRAPSCPTPKQHFQQDTSLQAHPRTTLAPSRFSSPSVPHPCSERKAPAHIDFYRARLKALIIETSPQHHLQSSFQVAPNGT